MGGVRVGVERRGVAARWDEVGIFPFYLSS
jgi:hypothetical protein